MLGGVSVTSNLVMNHLSFIYFERIGHDVVEHHYDVAHQFGLLDFNDPPRYGVGEHDMASTL